VWQGRGAVLRRHKLLVKQESLCYGSAAEVIYALNGIVAGRKCRKVSYCHSFCGELH